MRLLLHLATITILAGCHTPEKKQTLETKRKELDVGELTQKYVYTVDEIGWSVRIPSDWKIMTKRETNNNNERGKKLLEESAGAEINTSQLQDLVNFSKDKANSFLSNMEPYDESVDGSYDDHSNQLLELIKQTYKSKGMYAAYQVGATRIDGVMFDRIAIDIYSPDKEKNYSPPGFVFKPD